jgi:YbgC/YbaW family acyl-CoA thioester hydrolase
MDRPTYTLVRDVMFFDTDIGGVVHNLAYLRLIEEARTQLAFLMGMDLKEMSSFSVFPVLLKTEVSYLKPATLGDCLRIEGCLSSLDRVRFFCDFIVYRQSDSAELVKCRQALAIVKMPEGRPQRLPKEWIEQWS